MEVENYGSESFFSDGGNDYSSGEQQASPAPESAPQPQAPEQNYVPMEKFQSLQSNYERQQAAMEEFANRIAGRQPQNDPNIALDGFVKDPQGFVAQTVEQRMEQRLQEFQNQQFWNSAIERARTENPHLAPFEAAINSDGNVQAAVQAFQKANGRPPAAGYETVKAAMDHFQNTALQGWQRQAPQTQQQINDVRNGSIPLSTVGSPALQSGGRPNFSAMSDADFQKFQQEQGWIKF